jgi:ABC-2 type transport system ATP-binding protein
VIVDHGRVIAEGSPGELKARAGRDVIELHAVQVADLPRLATALAAIGCDEPRVDEPTRRVTVAVDGGRAVIHEAVRAVDQLGLEIDDIGLRRPTLDEVFLTLTGQPLDPSGAADDPDLAVAGATTP